MCGMSLLFIAQMRTETNHRELSQANWLIWSPQLRETIRNK